MKPGNQASSKAPNMKKNKKPDQRTAENQVRSVNTPADVGSCLQSPVNVNNVCVGPKAQWQEHPAKSSQEEERLEKPFIAQCDVMSLQMLNINTFQPTKQT